MLLIIFFFSSCYYLTDTQVDEKSNLYHYSLGKRKVVCRTTHVFSGFLPIPTGVTRVETEANPKTFVVLNHLVGKDDKNIYIGGVKNHEWEYTHDRNQSKAKASWIKIK